MLDVDALQAAAVAHELAGTIEQGLALLASLGELLAATGRVAEARAAYERCRACAEAVGHRRQADAASARLAGLVG